MRTTLLLVMLAAAILVHPQVAGALAESSLNGTYFFTYQTVTTDPAKLCNGSAACGGVNNVVGSIGQFYKRLSADLKGGKCSAASSQLKSLAGKIGAGGPKAGDVFYATGTLIADGNGNFTDGQLTLSSTSLNNEALNYLNQGIGAELCGGTDKSGGCASLCTAGSLNCASGGYLVSGNGGTATLFVYPQFSTGLCGPQVISADLCCNDPTLAVVVHLSFVLENVGATMPNVAQKLDAVITDQAQVGAVHGELQP